MNSTTQIIYEAAGKPEMRGGAIGVCRSCGSEATGQPFDSWVRDTFTDRDKLKPGLIICHACQFCFADQNSLLTVLTGKEKLQRMRNYSHFVCDGRWYPLSKGQKKEMRALLLDSPSVAIIAESGQKHIIFRAQPGWWQFEENRLLPCPELLTLLLSPIESLYNAGANKSEIETGRYSQKTIRQIGIENWQGLDSQIKPYRGGLPLKLALFLAQKGEDVL